MKTQKSFAWIIGILFIIAGISYIVFGVIFHDSFRTLLCIFIGVGMIISNIFSILFNYYGISYDVKKRVSFLFGFAGLTLGAFYIPFHGLVMSIVCGSFIILSALARIILASVDKIHYKREIPNLVIGIFVIWNIFDWFFIIMIILFGASIIIFGIHLIILPYLIIKRKKKPSIEAVFKEVEPDILKIEVSEE